MVPTLNPRSQSPGGSPTGRCPVGNIATKAVDDRLGLFDQREKMTECHKCKAEIGELHETAGRCLSCGNRYVTVREGETWSPESYVVAVWESFSDTVLSTYGVSRSSFEVKPPGSRDDLIAELTRENLLLKKLARAAVDAQYDHTDDSGNGMVAAIYALEDVVGRTE